MYLERIFQQDPHHIAVCQGDIRYTYGQLYAEAQQLAAFLRESRGPLLVFGHKHPRMMVSLLACLLSGRAWVPCDSSLPAERIHRIMELCGAEQLFYAEDSEIDAKIPSFHWSDVPFSDECFEFSFCKERIAYIMFTSGSTGTPKGIPISCGNLENFARWILQYPQLSRTSILNQANLSFDLSVADWCLALCNGRTLLLNSKQDQFELARFFSLIQKQSDCTLVCTPTFLRLCLCVRSFCQEQMPALKAVFLCGELLPKNTAALMLQRFPDLYLFNAYGPTEATCAVCGVQITAEHLEQDLLPVGEISTAAVRITIEQHEICLEGDSVFHGYLNQEVQPSCYHSGDLGTIEQGLLYCFGRKDSQIKYMGYRIDLAEIRHHVEAFPDILQAVIVPQYDRSGGVRRLTAYLQPFPACIDELRHELAKQLPSYMIPSLFFPMEELPLTPNVKVKMR